MSNITTVIVAKDEERNIARTVRSVRELGPVIVADTGSTDRTREIAEKAGAKVYRIDWKGFGPSKQEACGFASTDYVLSVDADEVVSSRLAREIRRAVESNGTVDGYFLSRVTNFCGSWIFHSGWYPEYILRLFKKESGSFTDDMLHEHVVCNGKTARLTGRFLHYSYPDITQYAAKLDTYARLGARRYRDKGGRQAFIRMFANPPVWFVKKFIIKLGFADGVAGLWIAVLTAVGQFLKYKYALTGSEE
jgi:glycosyltransferase involved in cell wall biosynthesis